MRRLPLLAFLVLSVLAVPASASAANLGSDHPAPTHQWECGTGSACLVLQGALKGNTGDNVVPKAGKLSGFTVTGVAGNFRFVVVREVAGTPQIAAQTGDIAGQGQGVKVSYTLTPNVPVLPGDSIGVQLDPSATIGVRDAAGDTPASNLYQFGLGNLASPEDDQPFEVLVSANYVPNATTGGTGGVVEAPVKTTAPARSAGDPLAALRSGKRPAARIAGGSLAASKKGVAGIRVTNPNGYALKGSLNVAAGKLKLGKARVSLPAGATKAFKVKLSKKGMRKLRKRGKLRATVVGKLKGPIGKATTVRRKLTLKAPAKPKKKQAQKKGTGGGGNSGGGKGKPGGGRNNTGGGNAGGGEQPESKLWKARLGDSGGYDDFEFTLDNGQITLTRPALVLVTCSRTGALSGIAGSSEIFNHEGPWTLGESVAKSRTGRALNTLVGRGERGISYKLASQRSGDKITGSLTMTFSDSHLVPYIDPYTGVTRYNMAFTNCVGVRNFEAVNAG